jgi:hypothetical protein
MGRVRKEVAEVPEGFAEEVERAVRETGALALTKVKPAVARLSRRAEAALFETLARRGLERTARAVRVPLRDQLAALLERGDSIATAALRKHVKGVASAAELKLALADLVKRRRAALVMRAGKEHVVAPSPALLTAEELSEVAELARALAKLLTSARVRARQGGGGRTLLRADLVELLDAARRAVSSSSATAPSAPGADPLELVVAAVRGRTNRTTGLAYVPDVVRSLGGRLDGEALRAALVGAATSGLVELRPESGVALLSAADADACPRGPDGSPLSWARLVGRAAAGGR